MFVATFVLSEQLVEMAVDRVATTSVASLLERGAPDLERYTCAFSGASDVETARAPDDITAIIRAKRSRPLPNGKLCCAPTPPRGFPRTG